MTQAMEESKATEKTEAEAKKAKQAWREKNVPLVIGISMFGLLALLAFVVRMLNS